MYNYWDNFYQKSFDFTNSNSNFSEWCLKYISNIREIHLIDIGCGNGRDLSFFSNYNIKCKGIDTSKKVIEKLKQKKLDVESSSSIDFNYKGFNVLYCRFLLHTLNLLDLKKLLKNISDTSDLNSILFIETRLSENGKDYSKDFNSGIGESHIRYLYSEKTLLELIEKNFEIETVLKSKGLSKFADEDPLLIRIIAKNKKTTL